LRKCHGFIFDFLLGVSVLVLLGGCANTLVFSTATTFGLDISQRPEQTINVTLGYDRVEVASIPAPRDIDASDQNDTYSVLGIFHVQYGNPWKLEPLTLHQFFATGMAARTASQNPQLREFFGQKAAEIAQEVPKP
jgi:hypothetical protein